MFGIHDFGIFLAAAILLNLTPGQDTLYIVGRAVAEGRSIGIAAALGISTGTLLHTLAAALGVSAILATSATAFVLLKLAGAAYLLYLGARLLLMHATAPASARQAAGPDVRSAFRQGVITNVTNPKVALFFLAFLPQFVDPANPRALAGLLVLGVTFVVSSMLWCFVLALSAAQARRALTSHARAAVWLRRLVGGCFMALGVRLALVEA